MFTGFMRTAILCFGVVLVGTACEAKERAPKAGAPDAASQAAVPQEEQTSPETLARQRIAKETRAKLDGTTWTLELKPYQGAEGTPTTDTITFHNGQVTSERLAKEGYAASTYTVNLQGNTPLWETMQVKEGEGTATWSGELYGDVMSGILTKRPASPDQPARHFSFSGKLAASPASVPAAPPAEETPSQEAAPSSAAEAPLPESAAASPPPPQRATSPEPAPPQTKKKGWLW